MSFTVRRINANEYERARALWDACFPEDAGGYSAYYFARRTRPEYVIGVFENGRMIGGLHALPYTLIMGGTLKKCAMIAGVATLEAHRHRGVASAAIGFAHDVLKSENYCAALLKPDVDFYARYGYVPFAYHDEYTLQAGAAEFEPAGLHAPDAEETLHIYNAFAKKLCGMMARSTADMQAYLDEAALSGGAVSDGENYALFNVTDEGADVYELAGLSPQGLLTALAKRYGAAAFRYPSGMALEGLTPRSRMMFSMICPLDEAALLAGTGARDMHELLGGRAGICCTLEFC